LSLTEETFPLDVLAFTSICLTGTVAKLIFFS